MNALLADVFVRNWSIGEIAILIVVIAAICALVAIALRQFNVSIPSWVIQIFWVLGVAFLVILGIRLLMSM